MHGDPKTLQKRRKWLLCNAVKGALWRPAGSQAWRCSVMYVGECLPWTGHQQHNSTIFLLSHGRQASLHFVALSCGLPASRRVHRDLTVLTLSYVSTLRMDMCTGSLPGQQAWLVVHEVCGTFKKVRSKGWGKAGLVTTLIPVVKNQREEAL